MSETRAYGGKTAEARTVVVYGTCQAVVLAEMLASLDDLNDDYRFVFAANHALPGEALPRPVPDADLRSVALLLEQPGRENDPALLALKARLPAACPVIRYPTLWMNCLWPFECPEPRKVQDPAYLWGRYPHGDMIGLEIARTGLRGPLAVAAYLDLSARKMPDLHRRLERDLDRMHADDKRCDVRLGDYVQANFMHEQLFWTYGHVSRAAMAEMASRVAAVARPLLGGSAGRAAARLATATGPEGMEALQLPIHPLVAERLGLGYGTPDQVYRWYGQAWTFFEYIERYIAYDVDW